MAGWIKLWRKLIENGHLKMPGTAFKLWIYCLLEAVPYPDYKRSLDAGELWLSYQSIKDNLAEPNKNVSNSTISGALKYLEQHGYVTLHSEKFKGIKVKVVNWNEYQVFAYSAAAESKARRRITAPGTGPPGTLTVPDKYSHSTRRVLPQYPTGTPTVLDRAAQPHGHKDSGAPKNYIENSIKNINPVAVVTGVFEREFGRSLSPIEINQLVNWRKTFSDELIKEALARASLQDKRTIAYIGGILKNWQNRGITTVEAARQEQPGPGAKGGKRNARGKAGYRPGQVDWANEPDTL